MLSFPPYCSTRTQIIKRTELSLKRAELVKGQSLIIGRSVGIPEMLRLGAGEAKQGGTDRDSIIADAFETLMGAVQLDAGMEAVEKNCETSFYGPSREI